MTHRHIGYPALTLTQKYDISHRHHLTQTYGYPSQKPSHTDTPISRTDIRISRTDTISNRHMEWISRGDTISHRHMDIPHRYHHAQTYWISRTDTHTEIRYLAQTPSHTDIRISLTETITHRHTDIPHRHKDIPHRHHLKQTYGMDIPRRHHLTQTYGYPAQIPSHTDIRISRTDIITHSIRISRTDNISHRHTDGNPVTKTCTGTLQ